MTAAAPRVCPSGAGAAVRTSRSGPRRPAIRAQEHQVGCGHQEQHLGCRTGHARQFGQSRHWAAHVQHDRGGPLYSGPRRGPEREASPGCPATEHGDVERQQHHCEQADPAPQENRHVPLLPRFLGAQCASGRGPPSLPVSGSLRPAGPRGHRSLPPGPLAWSVAGRAWRDGPGPVRRTGTGRCGEDATSAPSQAGTWGGVAAVHDFGPTTEQFPQATVRASGICGTSAQPCGPPGKPSLAM